ncbi:hypothetical protein Lalb_Chr13g0299421 [Lupinus albus]|uniref:Uncharacterized protein n=1 Tax=Lupinus albus TaxID=3870 RepID=A0A6A4PJG3_LUPAL|nr:hypothetical protein Lalb_Chr13g0299421 [Lupinus albus]
MARDKSIDKPMKPRRAARQRPSRNGNGGGGGSAGGRHSPVVGIFGFLLGIILLCLFLFTFFYFMVDFLS